jgi:hypothetical protein
LSKPFEEWSQEDYEQYYLYEEQQFAQHWIYLIGPVYIYVFILLFPVYPAITLIYLLCARAYTVFWIV